jgi:hypothetical protein
MSLRPFRTVRGSVAAAAVVLTLALSGCSQITSLVPVSGVPEATVRIAAIDVLTSQKVAVLVAPVCTAQGDTISCTGTTAAKEPIAVTSAAKAPYAMTVTVAGREIFSGTAQDVIADAGQATP